MASYSGKSLGTPTSSFGNSVNSYSACLTFFREGYTGSDADAGVTEKSPYCQMWQKSGIQGLGMGASAWEYPEILNNEVALPGGRPPAGCP